MDMFTRKTGVPNPVDIHVGQRLRQRRSLIGISQERLADAIGITFQQIQKYERGANRVSASRLYQFSKLLGVPVSFFFERFGESEAEKNQGAALYGLSDSIQESFEDRHNAMGEDIFNKKETLDLLKIYYSVKDEKDRNSMAAVLKTMAASLTDS